MRSFVSYAHMTSGLVAPLPDLVIFSFCVVSSFLKIDVIHGYIREARVARLRMWDLNFPFVINYKFVLFFFALL